MSDSDPAQKLNAAIAGLEAQRETLGAALVDAALAGLRLQAAQLEQTESVDERKLVTIVFSDISGFTALAEKQDPEKVRELINACFDRLVPMIQKYEGTIDKFIGDEIMALFERLHQQGNTIVLVTHEHDIALHAHRIIFVRDGKVAKDELVQK